MSLSEGIRGEAAGAAELSSIQCVAQGEARELKPIHKAAARHSE